MRTPDVLHGHEDHAFRFATTRGAEPLTPEMSRLLRRVTSAIEHEPIEDGIAHSAEPSFALFLRSASPATLYAELFEGHTPVSHVAGLVRLLGRQKPDDPEARQRIMQSAMASSSAEIRDAAVQAAELWQDPTAFGILRRHVERAPWLADYIGRVLAQVD